MTTDVGLRCSCGAVRGVARVSGATGTRLICYCNDCQSFAHFLERADDVLDAHGGTDIYQMAPRGLEITVGADQLGCVRLSVESYSLRWYTTCCLTPVANTRASPQIPLVGVIHGFMDHASGRDAELGPVRARLHGRFATGDATKLNAHAKMPASLVWRTVRILLVARMKGHYAPSPFFDSETGRPTADPRVLTEQERREVEARRDGTTA